MIITVCFAGKQSFLSYAIVGIGDGIPVPFRDGEQSVGVVVSSGRRMAIRVRNAGAIVVGVVGIISSPARHL
jgi:primosomal protein N'